jgi:hypothetical protein
VTCDLVSLRGHTLDHSRPRRARIIYGAFADVISSNKERCFRISGSEQVQKFVGVYVGAIVVCYSNCVRYRARIDSFSTVGLIPELGAGDATGAISRRKLVGVAGRTIFEKTVRGTAKFDCETDTMLAGFSGIVCFEPPTSFPTPAGWRAAIALCAYRTSITGSTSSVSTSLACA